MFFGLPYKTKQFFFVLIKLSIVAGASYYVYNRLVNNGELDFQVFIDFLSKNSVFTPKNIFFILFLTIFNWFFEILKWQNLVSVVQNISFFESFKQCTSSLTASLFTPNRIGDYAAKAVYYSTSLRKRIMLLNLMSNMAQMTVTFFIGLIGLISFASSYELPIAPLRLGRFVALVIDSGSHLRGD